MRVRLASFQGLCFMVLLGFVLALSAIAQDKAPKGANVQGTVMTIKKDTSTITVNTSDLNISKTPRQVMYSASTTFMYGHSNDNKPGTLDKVQMGNYISCTGAMEKGVLMATECVYRETK
jgi:hypothetical protein